VDDSKRQSGWPQVIRVLVRLLILVMLVWVTHIAVNWMMLRVDGLENAARVRVGVFGMLLLVYILLMAIPFVPGVEIGISLMMLEGGTAAPFVYLGTLAGLSIAYFVGRTVDCVVFKKVAIDLRLTSMSDLIDKITPMSGEERLQLVHQNLPKWMPSAVIRYRYVSLALLLNLPGNAVIGGGGGLALIAGFSGLYAPRSTVLTLALAVSPVPIMVYFLDFNLLG
jgi:hypothetical protein